MAHKIKGKGEVREVYDEAGALVGRIHRKTREGVTAKISPTKASIRKIVEVYWVATRHNDTEVRRLDGKRRATCTMKEWTSPGTWT